MRLKVREKDKYGVFKEAVAKLIQWA